MTIEKLKQQKTCAMCDRESFVETQVLIVSRLESGKIIFPFEKDDGKSRAAILPTCGYHMIMSQEGVYVISTSSKIIKPDNIRQAENMDDEQIAKAILKVRRSGNSKRHKFIINGFKIVQQARKFQRAIERRQNG